MGSQIDQASRARRFEMDAAKACEGTGSRCGRWVQVCRPQRREASKTWGEAKGPTSCVIAGIGDGLIEHPGAMAGDRVVQSRARVVTL